MSHPIENIMQTTMQSIRSMMDVNVVIGNAIPTAAGTIVPLSRVSVGFLAGGGEYGVGAKAPQGAATPFAGGAGVGVTLQPMGFLVVEGSTVRLLPANYNTILERVVEHIPDWVDKLRAVADDVCRSKAQPPANTGSTPEV